VIYGCGEIDSLCKKIRKGRIKKKYWGVLQRGGAFFLSEPFSIFFFLYPSFGIVETKC
jgi:hypothetical protein